MNAVKADAKAIFLEALDCNRADDLMRFLDQACEADADLRKRVEELMRAHHDAGAFLGGAEKQDATSDQPIAEQLGTVIGPYKLLQQIGEGGMGTVYMAEQTRPVQRKVALKVIKAGMDSKQVIARFEAERQALAVMDHVNIARVFDAGATESGRPYFVMELVHGVPITKYCDDNRLTPRERLELFVPVCNAIQHAHQKGIIHRDIKPTNVMITLYDGKPVPKVIDFGVAKAIEQKLTERTLFTQYGTMVGTLEYMSPEQAEMSALGVDTRSDIYSLGVLLYELLTGNTPLSHKTMKEAAYAEILRMIKEEEPPKPSTRLSDSGEALASISANRHMEPAKLTKLVRGELDWIVMKTLEKDRNRRYETAKDFAADVQRYLDDETVQACPPSAGYRLRKFARRNKAGLAIAGLVLFFIVLLGGVVGWGMRDRAAREQEIVLDTARKLALTEQGIRQALDRGSKRRAELHAVLTGPGGVRQLLNQPARWELFIKTGQGEFAQARQLAARAERSLDTSSTQAIDRLEQQLTSDQADFDLALRLEKIRMIASTTLDGKSGNAAPRRSPFATGIAFVAFNTAHAVREYPLAFAEAGLAVEPGREQETATRVGKSAIKHQLLAGLDDWAFWAFVHGQDELCRRVLAVARLVDPDPWRDQVRDPTLWKKREAFVRLADQAQNDPERFRQLTPQMLDLMGNLLRDEKAGEAWLRRAQALHPADFWINFSLALRLKTGEGAIGFYRAALAVRPQSTAVYNNLGLVLSHQKDLAGAIDAYKKALAIDPQFAATWNNLATALRHSKDLPAAIDAHKKALAIDGQDARAWTNFGSTLYESKDLPGAIDAFKKANAIDLQFAGAWHNLGIALYESKDLPGAIEAFKKAVAIDEQNADAWANLGATLCESKDLSGAFDALKKAVAIDPKNAKTWNYLALALRASKDRPGAIDAYKKALAIDRQDAKTWSNFGATLHESNDLHGAIDAYRKALDLDQKTAIIWINLGLALANTKDLPGAIDAYKKALAIDAQFAPGWYNLGLALSDSKDLPGAIDAYKKAISIAPQYAAVHNALAWLLATCSDPKLRDPALAVALASKAVELAPTNPGYRNTLGAAYYRTGAWKAAIAALEKSMELGKGGDSADWFFLAMAHWQLGAKDKAREWYERAVKWMDKNQPKNEELRRFRAEAAGLLEMSEKKQDGS